MGNVCSVDEKESELRTPPRSSRPSDAGHPPMRRQDSKQPKPDVQGYFKAHTAPVTCLEVFFPLLKSKRVTFHDTTSDGIRWLASADSTGVIHLWDGPGEPTVTLRRKLNDTGIYALCGIAGGYLAAGVNGGVDLWNPATEMIEAHLKLPEEFKDEPVDHLVVLFGGALAGAVGKNIVVWKQKDLDSLTLSVKRQKSISGGLLLRSIDVASLEETESNEAKEKKVKAHANDNDNTEGDTSKHNDTESGNATNNAATSGKDEKNLQEEGDEEEDEDTICEVINGGVDKQLGLKNIEPFVLRGHKSEVISLCPLPNGQLASGSKGGMLFFWVTNFRRVFHQEFHEFPVTSIVTLPQGLVAAATANRFSFWKVDTIAESVRTAGGIDSPKCGGCIVALDEDIDKVCISAKPGQGLCVWDTPGKSLICESASQESCLQINADEAGFSSNLLVAMGDGVVSAYGNDILMWNVNY